MSVRIRIDHGQDAGKVWRLPRTGFYVLGRHPEATIRVLDMKVSAEHARILVQNGDAGLTVRLRDMGSTHGTTLNGQPVSKKDVYLKPGDEIRMGLSILRVLSDGKADVEAQPAGDLVGDTMPGAQAGAAAGPVTLPPDELVGQELKGYKVLAKIGQGGMGAVYLAEQMSLHRKVALKVLSEKFTADSNFVDQFLNEARAAGALNHPNVVQVYDVGKEGGHYFFSMEYVPGGSIEDQIKKKPADWRQALNWFLDAANALIFAQRREILHRDVKPDNLMLAENGSAKLCDLGLAKKSDNADLLAAGIIGTPHFISPEAIRRKREIDVRSDLYSLGCTFYRILTGTNPYPGSSVKEILLGHLNKPIPRVREKNPAVPKELDEAVFQLMQKDPEQRTATPEDLLTILDKVRVQHGLEAHGLKPATKKPLIIAGLVLLLGAAALVWALTRDAPEPVLVGQSPEEIAAQQQAQREVALGNFKNSMGDQLLDLRTQKTESNYRERWQDAFVAELADDFDALAEKMTEHEEFGEEQVIVDLAASSRGEAEEIRTYVEVRESARSALDAAETEALEELEGKLAAQRKAYDDAVEAKKWLAASKAITAEPIEEIVAPYREVKRADVLEDFPQNTRDLFADDLLLDPEDDIAPQVQASFPGETLGADLRSALLTLITEDRKTVLTKAGDASARATHKGYAEALTTLQGYLDRLPEITETDEDPVLVALAEARAAAVAARSAAESADKRLLEADRAHDHRLRAELVHALYDRASPYWTSEDGLLTKLDLGGALAAAREAAEAMRTDEKRAWAEMRAADSEAMQALFARIVETYPDGWVDDRVTYIDDRDRERTAKVQSVDANGITWSGDTYTWSARGADWIVHRLVFSEPGTPRFELDPPSMRGAAALAEVAIDYDLAETLWKQYRDALEADARPPGLDARLAALPKEGMAADAVRRLRDIMDKVTAVLDEHDPAKIGEDKFWERETRQSLLEKSQELRSLLQQSRGLEAALLSEDVAATRWGTLLRAPPAAGR